MLIAVAGLAGSGKTTTLGFLAEMGLGRILYVGGLIRKEVAARGLPVDPENEKLVRKELRDARGMAVFAEMAEPTIRASLNRNETVLIDAVCCMAEVNFYRNSFPEKIFIIGLDATFQARVARLANRGASPIAERQLAERDRYERHELLIDQVLSEASRVLINEGTLQELRTELELLFPFLLRHKKPDGFLDGARSD